MNLYADLHTHTIASGHAYSTINELAAAAAKKGLKAIALTDHGPALPGGPHEYHFRAMRFVPRHIDGVRILRGVEANILNERGDLDLAEEVLAELDFVMAGIHDAVGFCGRSPKVYTRALLAVMENPLVKCISHPGNPEFPSQYEEVVQAAVRTGTALEINNSSVGGVSRKGSCRNCLEVARLCARYGARVLIGSDAHIAQGVGVFDDAIKLVTEAGIPEEQVLNASWERLLAFLGDEG
ncbi:phosphatase [Geomonas limicola]|uniref:Phosphatase n=1 Tax=Geomonas limicola TaxID=2740186 RepID=A0A6V8N665_9BACT|nr:PHP domain-containing protein [Geomonas limicola]GFO67414.1 phosphatase [Geomonas limicola]